MIDRRTYDKLDGYNTSIEILSAIEAIAPDEFDPDDDEIEQTECHRIWAEPTDEEMKRVEKLAWKLADPEEMKLHWGETVIHRPAAA